MKGLCGRSHIFGALELERRPLVVGGGVVLAAGDYPERAGGPAIRGFSGYLNPKIQ